MSSQTRRLHRKNLSEAVRAFHAGQSDEGALSDALRLARADKERLPGLPVLLRRHGNQNFMFGETSFTELRQIFHAVRPRAGAVFCDAGAGYGHVVFYGAHVAPCRFRAIEILPARCAAMRRWLGRSGLRNVEILERDALTQDYDDVSYLFLNNPFFPDRTEEFLARIAARRRRALTVIALNNAAAALRANARYVEIETATDIPGFRFGLFRLKPRRSAASNQPALVHRRADKGREQRVRLERA